MPGPSLIGRFLAAFAIIYGLLIAPWPGFASGYSRVFREAGTICFGREGQRGIVRFQAPVHPVRDEIDAEILLAANVQLNAAGTINAQRLGLDSRGIGWVPTAFVTALVLATPVPWERRLRALGLALVLVNLYVAGIVGVYLWNRSSGQIPVSFVPFSPTIGAALEETLVVQLGASFVIPTVLWLGLLFRPAEWVNLKSGARPARSSARGGGGRSSG